MTQITATADTATASVTLDILKTTDVAKIVRTNVNGSEEVRTAEGQLPSPQLSGVVRTNLAINPSFETNITGYIPMPFNSGNGTLSRVATGGLFGSAFMRLTTTTEVAATSVIAAEYTVTLQGGTTYTASHYGKSASSAFNTYVYFFAGSSSLTGSIKQSETLNGWKRRGFSATIPGSGPQTIRVIVAGYFSGEVAPAGTTIDFDGILLETGDTLSPYFDGSSTDTTGFDYSWTGTAHASTSTLAVTGGRLILTDYEAAHGLNSYNVYAADGSMATGSVTLVIDNPWLSVPVMPQYSEQVQTITAYGSSREAATTVHRPLGRSDSLVVMGKLGDRTGSLEIFCDSYTAARKLERIFERGEIVQLRQRVEGMDMYFTATGIPVSPYSVQGEDGTKWALTINYVEVRRPIGNLAGALGWTFDELAASFVSFDAVTAAFPDFDALTLGDAIV